jgi:hypothetical protein
MVEDMDIFLMKTIFVLGFFFLISCNLALIPFSYAILRHFFLNRYYRARGDIGLNRLDTVIKRIKYRERPEPINESMR